MGGASEKNKTAPMRRGAACPGFRPYLEWRRASMMWVLRTSTHVDRGGRVSRGAAQFRSRKNAAMLFTVPPCDGWSRLATPWLPLTRGGVDRERREAFKPISALQAHMLDEKSVQVQGVA